MRPLLNYFGGKWRIAPWIIEQFPAHDIYCEPFGGSLSVLLRKPRSKREVVNDIDRELYNLYVMARNHGSQLKELLSMTPHARDEYKNSMSPATDPIEQARRTIVRCYFGIGDSFLHNHNAFRTSKTSNTCVAKSWKNYIDCFEEIMQRLSGVTIENLSYEKLFLKYDGPCTLWYLDPPYLPSTRTKKHNYREDWSEYKHLEFLNEIKFLKGNFVLSGYPSAMYEKELAGFKSVQKEALGQKASRRTEVLWIK